MYKSVLIADLHLKDFESIGGLDRLGFSLRTTDKLNSLMKSVAYAIAHKVDSFIVLGDLFDGTRFSEELRALVSSILSNLIKDNIQVLIVGGNHDTNDNFSYNLDSESNLCDNIIAAKNYSIYLNDQKLWLRFIASGLESEIDKITSKSILFSHLQLIGAKFDNERLSDKFISIESLQKFEAVFTGHFHKRQRINNCRYIGALCRNNFGEKDNESGFLYLELGDGRVSKEEYIPIEDRVFESYEVFVSSEKDMYDYIDSLNIENKIIKIEFNIGDLEIHPRKIKEYAKSLNPFHIDISFQREHTVTSSEIKTELSYKDAFDSYNKLNKTSKHLIKIGQELLESIFENN